MKLCYDFVQLTCASIAYSRKILKFFPYWLLYGDIELPWVNSETSVLSYYMLHICL